MFSRFGRVPMSNSRLPEACPAAIGVWIRPDSRRCCWQGPRTAASIDSFHNAEPPCVAHFPCLILLRHQDSAQWKTSLGSVRVCAAPFPAGARSVGQARCLRWTRRHAAKRAPQTETLPESARARAETRRQLGSGLAVASFAAPSFPRRRESIYGARCLRNSPDGFPPSRE